MPRNPALDSVLTELLKDFSAAEIAAKVRTISRTKADRELTIIVNQGMHSIPDDIIRGDRLVFSEGTLDLSENMAESTVAELMRAAHVVLSRRLWNKVYIIPSGHPLLVVAATMICYRTVRIDPIVVSYFEGEYLDVPLHVRRSIFAQTFE